MNLSSVQQHLIKKQILGIQDKFAKVRLLKIQEKFGMFRKITGPLRCAKT